MAHGWTGTNLEVDLTRSTIQKVKGDPAVVRNYLGGKGINARILWERVPPSVDALSPDNLVIIGAGLLCGTAVPGANRTIFTYKSPTTNLHSWSGMGGFFAPELKNAGYDRIIIRGKSAQPVYLWVNDDRVELRDASYLWGKSTHETRKLIRQELKDDKIQIAGIGLAGENRAYAASVEHSTGASASRGGLGAIWGDKKLKAVAVRGTQDVKVANSAKLFDLCNQILSRSEGVQKRAKQWKLTVVASTGIPQGNHEMTTEADENSELGQKMRQITEIFFKDAFPKRKVREVACYNCILACKWTYAGEGDAFPTVKCGSIAAAVKATKIIDPDFGLKAYSLFEEYGFDSHAVIQQVAFAIDLYEKGILTKADTDGMHLEFGNPEVAITLLDKIARREGIGDILANGVYRAAQQIGKGAEKYAHHVNKQEPWAWDLRGKLKYVLEQAVNDKPGDVTRLEAGGTGEALSREEREEYVKQGWFNYPKEYEKYFLSERHDLSQDDPFVNEGYVRFVAYKEEMYTINDLIGVCYWWGGWWGWSPFRNRAMVADIISSATGMDIDEAELTKIASKTISLIRAYNVREGQKRDHDNVEDAFFEKAPLPPYHQISRDHFNRLVDRFYELKGRDKEGIPTRQTLQELGLDDVRQDLEARGILVKKEALAITE